MHAHASTSEVVRPHKHARAIVTPVGPPVEATASGSPGIGQPADVAELPLTRARKGELGEC